MLPYITKDSVLKIIIIRNSKGNQITIDEVNEVSKIDLVNYIKTSIHKAQPFRIPNNDA